MVVRARPAAVAGAFYPGSPARLRTMVEGLLREAPASPVSRTSDTPKAIIAPHAGYVYSGPIAASAFQTLAPPAGRIGGGAGAGPGRPAPPPARPLQPGAPWAGRGERVVVLGPSHFVPFRGLALPGESRFETPLGEIAVSPEAAPASIQLPQVRVQPRAR